jgi:hypothetical protein
VLTAHVRYGREGYRLHAVEVPLWALVAESAVEWLDVRVGHRLCATATGQRLLGVAARRQRDRWSAPLSETQVWSAFPQAVVDLDE